MRRALFTLLAFSLACGGSTDTKTTRYNFAVVDGLNQASTAGSASLSKPITSQLTRDPQGKFATRVFDFFAPAITYAQSLSLSGDPVAGAIVCGRVAPIGEPQVVPLCAFTLADGKAANVVVPGTKAGAYDVLFSAQVPSEAPVVDSTKVTVEAGAATAGEMFGHPSYTGRVSPATLSTTLLADKYGNQVGYKLVVVSGKAHAQGEVIGSIDARTLVADGPGSGTLEVWTAEGKVGSGTFSIVENTENDGTVVNRMITFSF